MNAIKSLLTPEQIENLGKVPVDTVNDPWDISMMFGPEDRTSIKKLNNKPDHKTWKQRAAERIFDNLLFVANRQSLMMETSETKRGKLLIQRIRLVIGGRHMWCRPILDHQRLYLLHDGVRIDARDYFGQNIDRYKSKHR